MGKFTKIIKGKYSGLCLFLLIFSDECIMTGRNLHLINTTKGQEIDVIINESIYEVALNIEKSDYYKELITECKEKVDKIIEEGQSMLSYPIKPFIVKKNKFQKHRYRQLENVESLGDYDGGLTFTEMYGSFGF